MQPIRLIHWKADQAGERRAQLEAQGYQVEYAPLDAKELRAIRADPPAAILIDLTRSRSEIELVSYHKAYGSDFEDMQRRVPSIEKINELIGYDARTDLDAMLLSVINYIKRKGS